MRYALRTHGPLRIALVTSLIVWALTSLVATVEENRTTWLLLAMIAVAGRLASDDPSGLIDCFSTRPLLAARDLECLQSSRDEGKLKRVPKSGTT